MIIGALMLTLHIEKANNLKIKRKITRSLIERVRNKFNISITDLTNDKLWQRLELGVVIYGNQLAYITNKLDEISLFIQYNTLIEITDIRAEVINLKEMTWTPHPD